MKYINLANFTTAEFFDKEPAVGWEVLPNGKYRERFPFDEIENIHDTLPAHYVEVDGLVYVKGGVVFENEHARLYIYTDTPDDYVGMSWIEFNPEFMELIEKR